MTKRWLPLIVAAIILGGSALAEDVVHTALLRDISSVEGIRDNPVFGYGIVVGLRGTGDKQQTIFCRDDLRRRRR